MKVPAQPTIWPCCRRDAQGSGRRLARSCGPGAEQAGQELPVAVQSLAQFDAQPGGRGGKRLTITDLPDSGDLENTADSVLGLYRDELHHADTHDTGLAELIVLKKRQLGDDVGSVRRLV
jgi:replicative DNA helicase